MLKVYTRTAYVWEDGSELQLHQRVIAKSRFTEGEYWFIEVKSFNQDAIEGLYTYVRVENNKPVKVFANLSGRFSFKEYTFEKWV